MDKLGYLRKIRTKATNRGIRCLLHFTPVPNLASITTHGLLSRADLSSRGLSAYTSIGQRLDRENKAISVSISAINYYMFKAKRNTSKRADWVVLILCPSILWSLECRFFSRNAARKMWEHRRFLGGPWAFNEMFSQTACPPGFRGGSYRVDTGIPDVITTFSDAEIQVMEPIHPDYIKGAWVNHMDVAETVWKSLSRLNSSERDVFVQDFSPRFDNGFDRWG